MSFCSFFGGEVFQNHFEPGVYVCAKCGYELFSSRSKYAHSSPWPAFTETIHADSVDKRPERNSPEALKAKELLALRSCRWAAHTHSSWTLPWSHSGHRTLELEPQTFRRGGGGGWLKHQEVLALRRLSLGRALFAMMPVACCQDEPGGPAVGSP
ncbi:methionine-R-sulfoxide reductase B1 isoform X1 [Zalophus californianus]|uniref:Methionine-R-sulfoxide reductase B1 n=1 Tax=Zalophus californianus TaxID=9704 RepID=A0A6J2EKI9_ZALCA|nr:methionine-R-sulfoxide reductase B1 isoform X1 [Zalophus californianus]